MMSKIEGPVLITGCSSGIGRATALRLARAGHTVIATARNRASLDDIAKAGAEVMELDVADEASRVAAVQAIESKHGSIAVLVNNAGYGEYGPVEEVGLDRVRKQFETNVFGLARMCQLVLPGMRKARRGRIINVSSMGGRLVLPLGGYYHATKYAVEALSDALRSEIEPMGLFVTLVEPGTIKSEFNTTIEKTLVSDTSIEEGPYAGMKRGMVTTLSSPMASSMAGTPDDVARVIERAATARRPKTRAVVTLGARMLIFLRRWLPDRTWDAVSRRLMAG
jgi:NAD(P)-dependent dehydrogenase (short-subunit alcohol dehydrogenase family)